MHGRVAAVALLLAAGMGARGAAQVAKQGTLLQGTIDDVASRRRAMPSVSLQFELAGAVVPKFTLTIYRDATGMYEGEAAVLGSGDEGEAAAPPQLFHRELTVSTELAKRIFLLAAKLKDFKTECESRAKNMAETGKKTLIYRALDDEGSCTYNYSDDERVQEVTSALRGVAETMDVGRRLEYCIGSTGWDWMRSWTF